MPLCYARSATPPEQSLGIYDIQFTNISQATAEQSGLKMERGTIALVIVFQKQITLPDGRHGNIPVRVIVPNVHEGKLNLFYRMLFWYLIPNAAGSLSYSGRLRRRHWRSGAAKKVSMRKALQSWPVRIGALVLAGIVLYGAAYTRLPGTADSVSVTVLQCATAQVGTVYTCPGTTLFHRTFMDAATVSGVRSTLEGLHKVGPFTHNWCPGDWGQSRVYSFDLLWHGRVVQSYVAPTNRESRCWWNVTTLGVPSAAIEGPTRTWQDLVRLTGMPDLPFPAP